jgi:GTPase SAR1 family protein
MICFNVAVHKTYYSVTDRWIPELGHFALNTPFILVGTHIDLRPEDMDDKNLSEKTKDRYARKFISTAKVCMIQG